MYTLPNKQLWNGRIDSKANEKQFRFHQVTQCMDINDVDKDESAFTIIGFESDEGVRRNKGRVGAALAPDKIKQAIAKLPFNIGDKHIIDVGNVSCEQQEMEKAQAELGSHVNKLFRQKKTPIILGGGHETLYGHYLGVREFIGNDSTLGIINIDAHFDMRDDPITSSGTMFRQILDQDTKANYLCLGVQDFGNTKALFETADEYGCKYIMEEDITTNNYERTFQAIDTFASEHDYIMLTLCSDSIISYEAPGVSAPSPFGLESKVVRDLLRYIVCQRNITSFDISEINPAVDSNEQTVRLAAYLISTVLKNFHIKDS